MHGTPRTKSPLNSTPRATESAVQRIYNKNIMCLKFAIFYSIICCQPYKHRKSRYSLLQIWENDQLFLVYSPRVSIFYIYYNLKYINFSISKIYHAGTSIAQQNRRG